MPTHRATDLLYNSAAALRLVMSELGELHRRNTPAGALLWGDEAVSGEEVRAPARNGQPAIQCDVVHAPFSP